MPRVWLNPWFVRRRSRRCGWYPELAPTRKPCTHTHGLRVLTVRSGHHFRHLSRADDNDNDNGDDGNLNLNHANNGDSSLEKRREMRRGVVLPLPGCEVRLLSRSHLTLANRWLLSFVLDGRQRWCCRVAEWPTGYTIGDDRDGQWSTRGGSGQAVSTTTLAQLGDLRRASRRRCCNNSRRVPCSSQQCWVDSATRDRSDGQHRLNDNVGTTWDDSATELVARLVDTTRMSVGASPDDGD